MVNVKFKDINEAKSVTVVNRAANKWQEEHKGKTPLLILYFVEDVDFNAKLRNQVSEKLIDLIPVESSWKVIKRKKEKIINRRNIKLKNNRSGVNNETKAVSTSGDGINRVPPNKTLTYHKETVSGNSIITHNRFDYIAPEGVETFPEITETITTETIEGEMDVDIFISEKPLSVEFVLDIEMRTNYMSWKPTMLAFKDKFPDLTKIYLKDKRTFEYVEANFPDVISSGELVEMFESGKIYFMEYDRVKSEVKNKKKIIKKLKDLMQDEQDKIQRLQDLTDKTLVETVNYKVIKGITDSIIVGDVVVSKGDLVKSLRKVVGLKSASKLFELFLELNLESNRNMLLEAQERLDRKLPIQEILDEAELKRFRESKSLPAELLNKIMVHRLRNKIFD